MYALGVAARWIQPPSRFVIVTPGRAGSELLTDLLNSHPDITCEAEILQERTLRPERFVAGRSAKAGVAGAQAYGFKIHCGHFGYQVLRERPDFLRSLADAGFQLILLRRDNLLAQAISSTVASRTRWHWRGADRPTFTALGIDPVEVLMMAYLFEESDQFLQAALEDLPHLTLTYEYDLLDASAQQATVDRICGHLGLRRAPTASDHVRFTPKRLSETIANYHDVAQVVATTRFGRFLEGDPLPPSAGSEVGLANKGVVLQVGAGAREHDSAGLDDVGPVGQLQGPPSVLLDQQDSDAGVADGGDQGEHLLGQLGRQSERGFVEQ
jgi:LPS sulfotransferase NodH